MSFLIIYRNNISLNSYKIENNEKQTKAIELKSISKGIDKSSFYRPNYFFNL